MAPERIPSAILVERPSHSRSETVISPAMSAFEIYVIGETMRSQRAIANLRALLELHASNQYELEVIDVSKQPERAEAERVIATPMVLRRSPWIRRVIGDLSDFDAAARALGLDQAGQSTGPGDRS